MLRIGLKNGNPSKHLVPWCCVRCMMIKQSIIQQAFSASKYSNGVIAEERNYSQGHGYDSSIRSDIKNMKKIPPREPFVKNFFLGRFDKEIWNYPEVLDKPNYDSLQKLLKHVKTLFNEVDSIKIDSEAKISPEVLNDLKQLGLYGLQVPAEFGGLNLNATEYARLMEIISLDGSIYATLSAHQSLGLKAIMLKGTEEQRQKYLPLLASGEWTAAFCLTEPNSGGDVTNLSTVANLSSDGSHYLLSGTKTWVTNGGNADLMVVFAQTSPPMESEGELTAFIIDKNIQGITTEPTGDALGLRGADIASVTFKDAPVPVENILGEKFDGFKTAMNILSSGRYAMGGAGTGILKHLMKLVVNYADTHEENGYPLVDSSVFKTKMATMAADTYAIESMTYFVAGLIDKYDNQDCNVESAALKIYSSEKVWEHASECFKMLGSSAYLKSNNIERIVRDWRSNFIYDGTNEILRIFIGLSGLKHCAVYKQTDITKRRNPLFYPEYKMKSVVDDLLGRTRLKFDLEISKRVHPALQSSVDYFEFCFKQLDLYVDEAFNKEGILLMAPNNEILVKWLSEMAIDLFAVSAVLSRASRDGFKDLEGSDHELDLAIVFVEQATDRFDANLKNLQSLYLSKDIRRMEKIAENVFFKQGYAATPTIQRTWW